MNQLLRLPKRIIVLALVTLVAIGGVFQAGSTYSWFFFGNESGVSLTAGLVNYLPKDNGDGTFGSFLPDTTVEQDGSYIYPGRQLIALKEGGVTLNVLKLENHSTIDTNVRVRITGRIVTDYGQPGAITQSAICTENRDGSGYWLGLYADSGDGKKVVPLLNLDFGEDGYGWELVSGPIQPDTFEWELVPSGQTVSEAAIGIPPGGSQVYATLTSVRVVSGLASEAEELLFTELYNNRRLLLTIEYLAKQHDALDWQVFYENRFML